LIDFAKRILTEIEARMQVTALEWESILIGEKEASRLSQEDFVNAIESRIEKPEEIERKLRGRMEQQTERFIRVKR